MKIKKIKLKLKLKYGLFRHFFHASKILFWFSTGAVLALFLIGGIWIFAYQKVYENKIYPGIYVNNIDFSGKTKQDLEKYFSNKNSLAENTNFIFLSDYGTATISAKQINFGYDKNFSAEQAYSIGRSDNFISNFSLMLQAYLNGVYLNTVYSYDQDKLLNLLTPLSEKIDKKPVNAIFNFNNNRVTTFRASENGQTIDLSVLNDEIIKSAKNIMSLDSSQVQVIRLPIKEIAPEITTDKVNNLGIKELIGSGHSLFYHSIASRIYNINLAASRINGILVAPGETFSFDKALGDISAFTGYKQAYVIQNGKTVLGDGGGVCQVSTTFFRAILNAGLPVVERHAHAYRVGYYEEDSPPGFDATIFVPSVDLKFKNDTGHYILIQSEIDLDNLALTFNLYGTSDGRTVNISSPLITSQTPPPPTLYQDDPSLPLGTLQQTDFAAWGANVYFTRTVYKNGKTIIYDKFISNYQPWQAVYLRGTRT